MILYMPRSDTITQAREPVLFIYALQSCVNNLYKSYYSCNLYFQRNIYYIKCSMEPVDKGQSSATEGPNFGNLSTASKR